ncbi:hypothetical protein CKAH01_06831 [Colletotrichum kahawae]|uniref:Uncharacterized protein n=1 Tax=Colletotrichum kahawae TaxID=34407 RepID=A0AAD9Y8C1_COLKA|nr:hypothetical protein CKAH01_06831 [Colletotrichum kahawae]
MKWPGRWVRKEPDFPRGAGDPAGEAGCVCRPFVGDLGLGLEEGRMGGGWMMEGVVDVDVDVNQDWDQDWEGLVGEGVSCAGLGQTKATKVKQGCTWEQQRQSEVAAAVDDDGQSERSREDDGHHGCGRQGIGKAQKMQRRLEAISSIHLIIHLDAFEASTWALAAVQAECLFASWALTTKVRRATGKWALLLSPISRLPNGQGPDL